MKTIELLPMAYLFPSVTMQIQLGKATADIFTCTDGAADIPHDIVVYTHSNKLHLILSLL